MSINKIKMMLVALVLCIPFVGNAQTSQGYSGSGSGTESDPYRIFEASELDQMRNFLGQSGVYFKLMNDIDLTAWINDNNPSEGWQPIGISTDKFQGVLDGNGKKITGLMINRPSTDYVGFFGHLSDATVKDLSITGTTIVGRSYTGCLSGNMSSTIISNCHINFTNIDGTVNVGGLVGINTSGTSSISSSSVNITVYGQQRNIGKLVGSVQGELTASDCSAKGNIIGTNFNVGGLVGYSTGIVAATNCSSEGNIAGYSCVGGLIGYSTQNVSLTSCSSTGNIIGMNDIVGGAIGNCVKATVTKCSSVGDINGARCVGGLVGYKEDSATNLVVSNSFSLGDVTGAENVGGIVGRLGNSNWNINCTYEFSNEDYSVGNTYSLDGNEYTIVDIKYYSYHNGGKKYPDYCMYKYTLVPTSCNVSVRMTDTSYDVGNTTAYNGYTIVAKFYYSTDNNGYYYNSTYGTTSVSSGCKYRYLVIPTEDLNQIYNSYYNGAIIGTSNVGGIVGFAQTADIVKNYSAANINGKTNVGGIVGKLDTGKHNKTTNSILQSNVAINSVVNASESGAGRIYGGIGTDWTIGALGSSTTNKALLSTAVSINGVAQTITESLQHGNTNGEATLKKKASYQGIGWEMTSDWNIQETESYPYKSWQTAPPIIISGATAGSTTITGKCTDNGTVYIYVGDKEYTATALGNSWSVTVDPLQAGTQIRVFAKSETKAKSYSATSYVTYPGTGTVEDPYQVYSVEDLVGMNGNSYYKLMNDLDLTSWISKNSPLKGWVPLGRNSSVASNFDGDNHTISGLWISNSEDYTGLFGNASGATIKNLTVKVANGKSVKGNNYVGILLGYGTNAKLLNCNTIGSVEGNNYVAGLVGNENGGNIEGCSVTATVTAKDYAGGIAGASTAPISKSKSVSNVTGTITVGGIVGSTTATISECLSKGDIKSATANAFVGGIAGVSSASITSSSVNGTIVASEDDAYAGGIVAKIESTGSVTNCYNNAEITGSAYVGGIAAYSYAPITKCYASGNIFCTGWGAGIAGYNDGANAMTEFCLALSPKIELTTSTGTAKRVIGGYKNGAPDPKMNNYALKEMVLSANGVAQTITDNILHGEARTGNEFKQAAFLSALGWDMAETWGVLELNSYPYLKWEKTTPAQPEGGETGGDTDPEVSTADYAMSITPVYSASGTSVNLSVCMTNKNDINGFQFDIVLPEGVTAQKGSRGKYVFNLGERGDDHTFSSTLKEDGSIRVICTSMSNAIFTGNSGEVCQIPVDLAEDLVNGTYVVTLKNVSLSDTESTDIQASDVEGKITILNDYFEMGTVSGSIGKTITLPVAMRNKSANICGFQCDIVMPEGFSIATSDKGKYLLSVTDRGDDHSFSALDRGNNTVRVVCTSLTNATFTGAEGDLFEISLTTERTVEAGEYEIKLTNISLSNTASVDLPVADCKGTVTLKRYTPGDVNNDGKISVADVTAGISFVLGNESPSFIREAADMDANDEVKVNDVTAIISLVLNEGVSQAKGRMLAARTTPVETNAELYIEPFTIAPGEQKYINVMLNNSDLVTIGWQADVTLPEGLSFVTNDKGKYDVKTNEARTDGYSISTIKVDGKSNTVRYVGVSMENYAIEGESGAIMSVLVEAADNMTEGEYTGYVSNVALSDENSVDVPLNDSEYIATVAETKIDYATGYSLVIKPFKAAASTAYTLTMDMNCVDEDITDIEFDIVAPEVLARTKSGRAFKAPAFANDERIYVDDHSIDMTTDGHVTIEAITADEYRMIAGTSGSLVNFFYTANSGIAEGMYQFEIKNIKMTKDDGTVLDVAPYSADVYVGSPKAEIENGCVAFHGDYSTNNTYTLLKEAMPSEGVGAIDLTCVTAVPANTTIGSDGMLVYTSNDLKLKNTKNVVIGNTCDNLSLSDQYDFSAPKTFTAANATYTRPMTNEWGTVCLPYEVQSDENVAYYNIIDVQNGTLTIQKYETLPANTPALMQKVNGDAAVCEAHDVMVGGAMNNVTGEVTMHGSYANNIMVTDANAYYIKNNKFWLNNQYFYIDAFRAYFTLAPSAAKSSCLSIGDIATAIDTLTNGDKVAGVWSTNGVMRNNVEKGMNIIKMADGKCVKVLVK